MISPPVSPLRPKSPHPGVFRATPPAIFSPVFGLLGLGLAWRRGVVAFDLPVGLAEMLLGVATLLYLFCIVALFGQGSSQP